MTFDEDAPGVCALTVQFPDEAPAAIDYQATIFVQTGRSAQPQAPPGNVVATSGSWTVRAHGNSLLYVTTGSSMYTYQPETGC